MTTTHDMLEERAARGDGAAQVAFAQQLDGRGDHAAAIDWLARAARGDHAPALRLLGVRLSTADRAAGMPIEGAEMIRRAAKLGDGEASALLATFAALGYLQAPDWSQAVKHLRTAAAQGWAAAHAQLALLAGGPGGDRDGNRDGAIDAAAWREVPVPELLSAQPRIMSFRKLIPPAVCAALIARSRARLVRAEVFHPVTGQAIVEATRTNRVFTVSLFESDLVTAIVQERLAAAAAVPVAALEAMTLLNYRPGEQARPHFDFIEPSAPGYAAEIAQRGQRRATALVYLNEEYAGGATGFPELDIRYRGMTGDALLFFSLDDNGVPDRRTVHAGEPPLTGEKWVLSQFMRDRARG